MRKIIVTFLLIICFIIMCGCVSKSDVVGVWKEKEGQYVYFYNDGTYDDYNAELEKHINPGTWELNGNSIILNDPWGVSSFTLSDGIILDHQGNVIYKKISDDVSIDFN